MKNSIIKTLKVLKFLTMSELERHESWAKKYAKQIEKLEKKQLTQGLLAAELDELARLKVWLAQELKTIASLKSRAMMAEQAPVVEQDSDQKEAEAHIVDADKLYDFPYGAYEENTLSHEDEDEGPEL